MNTDPSTSEEQQRPQGPEGKEWTLQPQSEYRFELDPDSTLTIQLIAGRAEIFGAELALGRIYLFGNECKAGQTSTEYVSDETPMVACSNLHVVFEQMRIKAKNGVADAKPPRVMVIGPENSGKTSICKTLVNYALKVPRLCTPVLANVDPSEGAWTVPGTLSAAVISAPIPTSTPSNPFGYTATSAPTVLPSSAVLPIVYWYGHTDPKRNQPMFERTIENLASTVRQRVAMDLITSNSGLFVDTPSSFSTAVRVGNEMRYPFIELCVEQFRINTIIVIGHEKLNVDMQRLFGSSSNLTVIKIQKSGGVVDLDYQYRSRVQSHQIRNYFYGSFLKVPAWIDPAELGGEATGDLTLSPYSAVIKFGDLKIIRIGAETMAPSSALPIGASRVITELEPTSIDPATTGILNSVLALVPLAHSAKNEEEISDEDLVNTDVAGFLLVTSVDLQKQRLTVLSPNPGTVAGRTAIIGSFEWQEV